jgi:hypothetical protein
MDIPLDPHKIPHYLIQFDNGMTYLIMTTLMPSLIPKPDIYMTDTSHLLPPFIRLNSKITYKHDKQYRKGYLTQLPNGGYCFSYKSHTNKKHPTWSVPLPNLTLTWHDLCHKGVLIPCHNATTFVWDTLANFVTAANLIWECPCSLLTAIADTHLDQEIWLHSFWGEKDGIGSLNTYDKIILAKYCALLEKGAPQAIPNMCILMIKPDKKKNLHHTKSRSDVLENHKDRIWSKLETGSTSGYHVSPCQHSSQALTDAATGHLLECILPMRSLP